MLAIDNISFPVAINAHQNIQVVDLFVDLMSGDVGKHSQKVRKSTGNIRFQCFSMVGVSGFEPEASWTRTKRDTKLRHTPLAVNIIMKFACLVKCSRLFWNMGHYASQKP